MELGGKSPLIWDKSTSFEHAAYKLACFKFQNAGQTCITCDYMFIEESTLDRALKAIFKHIKKQYGIDKDNKSTWKRTELVGKIINETQLLRLQDMIETS